MSTPVNTGLASASPAAEDGTFIKRPPEDDESFDLHRTPSKRQALETALDGVVESELDPSLSLREPSLQFFPDPAHPHKDKNPEQLIAIICNMQAAHAQQVADLEARYSVVSAQLDQMKKLLNSYFKSQEQGMRSVSRVRRSNSWAPKTKHPSRVCLR